MPQSLSSILIHLVFSTRNREPFIVESIETELYRYLEAIFRECGCPSLTIGGDKDHVHALFSLSRTWAVSILAERVKSASSKWIKERSTEFREFQWQTGYGAFSVGQSGVEEVRRYIANQKDHHRKISFQHEFRVLCRKYKVEINERYVWD